MPPAPSLMYIRAYRSAKTVWIAAHDARTTDSTAIVGRSVPISASTSTSMTPASVRTAATRTTACEPTRVGSSRVACAAVSAGSMGPQTVHVQTTNTAAAVAHPASTAATPDVHGTTTA